MTQYIVVTDIGTYDTSCHIYETLEDALEWYWIASGWTKPTLAQIVEMVPKLPENHVFRKDPCDLCDSTFVPKRLT